MNKIPGNWILLNDSPVQKDIQNLISQFGYSEIFLKIISNRGIKTEKELLKFLRKYNYKDLYDPFLLPGIDNAVKKLLKAIKNKEKITIFGDYDADGVISTHLMSDFLKKSGLKVNIHIPDRIYEGYDINTEFLKELKKKIPDTSLIICVDCGTNSNEAMEYILKNPGYLEIVVVDHHIMSKESFEFYNECSAKDNTFEGRFIIVNPQLQSSKYPFRQLSGASVVFKLINALLIKADDNLKKNFKKDYLTSLMDLVAISTVSDLMPLVDENRVIVKWGLEVLKDTKNEGLKRLLKKVIPNKSYYSTYDLGYLIGPRLNASGRIKSAIDSFCLINSNECDYEELINKINISNEKRKKIQDEMLYEIINDKNYDFDEIRNEKKIFVAKSRNWHEGLIGLAASELVKKLNIPVILFKEEKNRLKGSGRSIECFNLFENLNKVSHFFYKFGGHRMACGITIMSKDSESENNLEEVFNDFKKNIEEIASSSISNLQIRKTYKYDCMLSFYEIVSGLYKDLKKLEPFGIGNPKPVFVSKDCRIIKMNFLKNNKHANFIIEQCGISMEAVKFNISEEEVEFFKKAEGNNNLSILYYLDENSYNSISYLQLVLLDLFYY